VTKDLKEHRETYRGGHCGGANGCKAIHHAEEDDDSAEAVRERIVPLVRATSGGRETSDAFSCSVLLVFAGEVLRSRKLRNRLLLATNGPMLRLHSVKFPAVRSKPALRPRPRRG